MCNPDPGPPSAVSETIPKMGPDGFPNPALQAICPLEIPH